MENRRKFRLADVILSVICVVFVAEAAAPVASIGNSQYFWWLFMIAAFLLPYGLIAEAKVLRTLHGVPHVIRYLIVAVFQMHPTARVEVGDALALGHRYGVLILADGQDDLSLVHLIWHMASFLCGLIVSNMYS